MTTQFGQYSRFQDPGPKTSDFLPSSGPPALDNKNQSRMEAKSDKMNPPNSRLDNFLAVAPKVEKSVSAISISWLSNFGARNRKKQCLDLLILMPCFQNIAISGPRKSDIAISGPWKSFLANSGPRKSDIAISGPGKNDIAISGAFNFSLGTSASKL